jgi:DNA polymerase phi
MTNKMGGKRKLHVRDAPIEPPAAKKHQGTSTLNTVTVARPRSQDLPPTPFLEKPQGQELKREVQLYEQLSSDDITERIEAGDSVVSGLFGGDGVSEAVLQRHLERRLIRGLASGRKAARLGFSVVLTEILHQLFGEKMLSSKQYPGLTLEKVLEILIAKTKPLGDLSGQEERDHAFGLLFGLQSFVRAKILFRTGEERWAKPLEMLLQLAVKKPWMREECGWIIVEALQQMEQTHAEDTVRKLYDIGLALTPEGVGVWLAARKQFPGMNFPDKPWGENGNPLEHIKALSRVLKESRSAEDDAEIPQAKQAGHWNPKLHFVWHMVTDLFIEGTSTGDTKLHAQFESFWKVAVDGKTLMLLTLHNYKHLLIRS